MVADGTPPPSVADSRATSKAPNVKEKVFEVDLTKPLVFQVGHLGPRYDEWVHEAVVGKVFPRLFQSDFCEFFTNTFWWMIPLIWLPVVAFAEKEAVANGIPPRQIPAYVASGLLIWSLIEYVLHRFLFHMRTTTYWMNTLHYLLHGCHHKHPNDPYRLVFPPVLCALFSAIIVFPFTLFLSYPTVMALYGGGLLGYVIYDITHYWLHHGVPTRFENLYSMRRYHLAHHFKFPDAGYGITSTLWDRVFGTFTNLASKKAKAED